MAGWRSTHFALLLLLVASTTTAAGRVRRVTASRYKGFGVRCSMTPINQVACRLGTSSTKTTVLGLWFGTWRANPAVGRQDYIPGEPTASGGTYWYTNNWCAGWSQYQNARCVGDQKPSAQDKASVDPPLANNSFVPEGAVQQWTYVTAMRVYYVKSVPVRVEWETQLFNASRTQSGAPPDGSPPTVVVAAVPGTAATAGCGSNVTALAKPPRVVEFVAPSGLVLSAFETSCRVGSAYNYPRVWLKAVTSACATERAWLERRSE